MVIKNSLLESNSSCKKVMRTETFSIHYVLSFKKFRRFEKSFFSELLMMYDFHDFLFYSKIRIIFEVLLSFFSHQTTIFLSMYLIFCSKEHQSNLTLILHYFFVLLILKMCIFSQSSFFYQIFFYDHSCISTLFNA